MTRLLLRAKDCVKDNRLPPEGFSTDHADYKYIKIIGAAAGDSDFNAGGSDPGGGSGADTVHYQIAVDSNSGPFTVAVEVCYQTVTPGEVNHLIEYDTVEAALFSGLYGVADKASVILKSLVLSKVQ